MMLGLVPLIKFGGPNVEHGPARRRTRAEPGPRPPSRAQGAGEVQVALALLLLICSGLMIRTFRAMMHVSSPKPNSLRSTRLFIPEAQIPDTAGRPRGSNRSGIAGKIASIPGVSSVAMTTSVPMDNNVQLTPCSPRTAPIRKGSFHRCAGSSSLRLDSSRPWEPRLWLAAI